MKTNTIENILKFLETKENKKIPQEWADLKPMNSLIEKFENHPDGVQYRHEGDLVFENSNQLKELPKDLYVTGNLVLKNCNYLKKLPNKLYVGGDLDIIRCESITELPNDLYVDVSFYLWECPRILNLPDNLHVESFLSIKRCYLLTYIPFNLYVGEDLTFMFTPISDKYSRKELHDIITSKGGEIVGDVEIQA